MAGVRDILAIPNMYKKFENMFARKNAQKAFADEYFRDNIADANILDLGCGTADIVLGIEGYQLYVGVDCSQKYIKYDQSKYSHIAHTEFYCMDLNEFVENCSRKFDLVIMMGVLHHINDEAVENAMENIKKVMSSQGQFVSLDPCYTDRMNPIAKLICKLDRGKYVRSEVEYYRLMKKHWKNVWYEIRKDTLRFLPYSQIVFKTNML